MCGSLFFGEIQGSGLLPAKFYILGVFSILRVFHSGGEKDGKRRIV